LFAFIFVLDSRTIEQHNLQFFNILWDLRFHFSIS